MQTSTASVNSLIIVIAFIGALLSGFIGMTVWKDKGGSPGGGSSSVRFSGFSA